MRLLTVLLFGVFLVATQVFLVLKAMQDNLFERDVDPVDAVMERQASISDELTPQERLWLSKNHTVRVGVDPDFYPLEKFDAEGRYTGIGPDYLRILHKMTGLSFRIAPPSDWTNTIDMATSHKVDMYIAAAETQHRSQYMLFTPSYIVLPGIIVTRQPTKGESVTRGAATDETEPSIDGLKDLAGKRVAVVNRYSWHDFLEELHPEITPVPVKNTLEGLQKVAFGEVDAMIDYQFNITEKINNSGIRNLRAAGSIDAPYGHAFGIRKETTFGHITRATLHTQMMRIDLFEGDRKFCSISLEGVCSLNLLARLEEEGIEVSDAVDGPMTKAGLCWSAIKPLTIVFNGMALVFSLVIAFMAVFTDAGARLLLLVPFLFLFIGGLLPLLMLSMPARGILEIGRQERELGFSFAEEMASRGTTGTSLVDDDWFIEISNARVVAFRRDYLKKVTAHENSESGDRCTVTTKGGRKIKVYAAGSTLEDLRSWFKQGAKARSTLDRAEDALETTSDWVV